MDARVTHDPRPHTDPVVATAAGSGAQTRTRKEGDVPFVEDVGNEKIALFVPDRE